ncbi:hypothetical protein FNH22_22415 [Fulvivirga sp. M361]|uniref:hypothetical protein n=1 Tax=Fulvivirga sp. M361 TaxID=2594266 RepID=UPI00117B725A|nr:hypothetical protein [Fulvivirga sp. M361]TRX52177.1 hypothetical protein FNH22_22415 [Fulvivirga sp. M361]
MRTSLNEIERIENYLLQKNDPSQHLRFEVSLMCSGELREKVSQQRELYEHIRCYGRKKLIEEIEEVHQRLFKEPEYIRFKNKILNIFNARK